MAYVNFGTQPAPDPHIWDELMTHSDGLGGGMLDTTELDATANDGYLLKGCPIFLDYADKKVHAVKSALVLTGGSTTSPRVNKNHLFKVGEFGFVSGTAVTIAAIDKTNPAYDVITFDAPCVGAAAGVYIEQANAAGGAVAGVKGIYTLTIGTNPTADDALTINGTVYTFAAAAAEGKIAAGATATATAANLQDTVEADNQDFVVKANGAKLVFTQKVAGTGALPTIEVTPVPSTGTLAATIAETLKGVAAASVAAKYTANALLGDSTKIIAGVTATCLYKIDQWVEKSKIPHSVSALTVAALTPNIILK